MAQPIALEVGLSINFVFQSGAMLKVVEMLHVSNDVVILTPALRTTGLFRLSCENISNKKLALEY